MRIKREAERWIKWMANEAVYSRYSRSLFPVDSFILHAHTLCGYKVEDVKKIYDYILNENPLGCFVTGDPYGEWYDDYFVLPFDLLRAAIKEANNDYVD